MPARVAADERLSKINQCFLSLDADSFDNINRFVALCGEILGATCALYNRLYRSSLFSLGQWNTPAGYNPEDSPNGHICYDVIKQNSGSSLLVRELPKTDYYQTDPNVATYRLKTYLGQAVRCQRTAVGSLCVVFQEDFVPTEDDEKLMEVIATAIGIEEERLKTSEESVRDILTGLYNRRYFNHRLDEEINRAERSAESLVILLCDIDKFREVNASRGHHEADTILQAVANSFQNSTRGIDSVFRWGGDEIVVILQDADRNAIFRIANRIRRGVQRVGDKAGIDLDVSVGASIYPEHGSNADELVEKAERALFIAKHAGDKVNIGEDEYQLGDSSIKVVFQPIVDTGSNQIIGHEALSRDPEGKLSIFQLFEKYSAIGKLQALKRVCYEAQIKEAGQVRLDRVFLNVDFDLLDQIETIPKPENVEVILEISEVEALRDIGKYLKVVERWRSKGFKFAIDDFGAGFISLPFIAQAAPEYIKLDRETVLHAVESKKFRKFAKELVQALLNYTTDGIIAEGIELEEELQVVNELGIHLVQGFIFGRPREIAHSQENEDLTVRGH